MVEGLKLRRNFLQENEGSYIASIAIIYKKNTSIYCCAIISPGFRIKSLMTSFPAQVIIRGSDSASIGDTGIYVFD